MSLDNYLKEIRLIQVLIKYADDSNSINVDDDLWGELNTFFNNTNLLESKLYELNQEKVIYFEMIGEDGFKPITLMGITEKTHDYLSELMRILEREVLFLESKLRDLIGFDPNEVKSNISKAQYDIDNVKKIAKENKHLEFLVDEISKIEKNFQSVQVVANNYDEVYKNIIKPIQKEGEQGVRQTVKWAIISIVVSTLVSFLIGNWSILFH
ncbi:hypothetical protein [Acinetobacter indicus]|uniref:hypothetical protein n=1 Tax=Acinetobacter indicus TaxID=756892 RepID=UPI0025775291|nr:hypothetical protein [Acinetobacter indicus]MDM1280647.1 hypothetical protein [Acinetobacter indicus]MDM1771292.1 hypothetical protein [Acinetobacter indicus]MDM1774044.1 hypothetical protein [Acinetobacter indicus]